MKPILIVCQSMLLVFSIGCVTTPLTLEEHGSRVADPLELDPGDMEFLNYCGYRIVPESQTEDFSTLSGIIGMTDQEISIATGNLHTVGKREVTKIPVEDIDGFSTTYGQLQIRHDSKLLVLFIYGRYPFEVDHFRKDSLVALLVAKDIPREEASIAFNYRSSRGSRYYDNDLPPTNLEASQEKMYPYTTQDGSVYNSGSAMRKTP